MHSGDGELPCCLFVVGLGQSTIDRHVQGCNGPADRIAGKPAYNLKG